MFLVTHHELLAVEGWMDVKDEPIFGLENLLHTSVFRIINAYRRTTTCPMREHCGVRAAHAVRRPPHKSDLPGLLDSTRSQPLADLSYHIDHLWAIRVRQRQSGLDFFAVLLIGQPRPIQPLQHFASSLLAVLACEKC